ncbi:MAG: hypothetical protein FJ381_00280 [Verrucomicrobia bacterium]|nr:hypothetical protein [Verrucomicrobiota bacterium]
MERTAVPRSRRGRLPLVSGIAGLAGSAGNHVAQSGRAREPELLAAKSTFAIKLRGWSRAEQTLARATEPDPGRADLWLSLVSARARAGRTTEAAAAKTGPVPTSEQIRVLGLLGRMLEVRSLVAELPRWSADYPQVRTFTEAGGVEQLAGGPAFWEIALSGEAR